MRSSVSVALSGAFPTSEVSLVLRAVDDDARAGHPTRSLGHEEGDHICDLFRLTHPLPRDRREHSVEEGRIAILHLVPETSGEVDRSRRHGVRANLLWREREGERIRVTDE